MLQRSRGRLAFLVGLAWNNNPITMALLWALLASPAAAQTTLFGDQVVVGTFTPSASPLTVVGLPAGQTGGILRAGTGGLVGTGALAIGDVPSVFTRRDVNETIASLWSFSTLRLTAPVAHTVGEAALWRSAAGDITAGAIARGDLPAAIAYEDEANTFTAAQAFSGLATFNGATQFNGVNTFAGASTFNADVTLGANLLPAQSYVSTIGSLSKKFLAAYVAESYIETLVAQDTAASINGRILVGSRSSLLTADLAAGATTIVVKHNGLASGDVVYLEGGGQVEFVALTSGPSGAGPYTYSVTRNLDGSGANAWIAGDAVFNTGTTGSGFLDLYALNGLRGPAEAGPSIVGNVRTGTGYANWAPRWALGRLDGLYGGYTSTSCPGGVPCYGAGFGDPSGTNLTIDPTALRFRNGTTTTMLVSGESFAMGNPAPTGINNFPGLWMSYNGGAPQFRVGSNEFDTTVAGDRIRWDGANLQIVSSALTIDGNGVKVRVLPDTPGATATIGYRFTMTSGTVNGLFAYQNSGGQTVQLTGDQSVLTLVASLPAGVSAVRLQGNMIYLDAPIGVGARSPLVIQNGVNGGTTRGIRMWDASDLNYGIYMATGIGSGTAGTALDGGNAPNGAGLFNSWAVRFRMPPATDQGWMFETTDGQPKLVLRASDGLLNTRTIYPMGDAVYDLGSSGSRFRDLYLALPAATSGFGYIVTADTTVPSRVAYYCGVNGPHQMPDPGVYGCASGKTVVTYQCGVAVALTCAP